MFFLGTLYLQRILGYDALEIGFAFLPATIAMGLMSARYSERLVMRFGARHTLIPGLVLIMAALALFTRAPVGGAAGWSTCCPLMLLLGFGAGMAFPALMSLAMSGVDAERGRPRVGPRQHDRAGGRRARAGGAGDALGRSTATA